MVQKLKVEGLKRRQSTVSQLVLVKVIFSMMRTSIYVKKNVHNAGP